MGTRTMSIQEALNELKTLDARIAKLLNGSRTISKSFNAQYGAVVEGKRSVPGYENNEQFEQKAKSAYQSIKALIERRTLIKRAVVNKNANTEIQVGNQTYTIAEAIERKNSIEFEKQLLADLQRQYTQLIQQYEEKTAYYRQKLDQHIENMVGKEQKDKFKGNEEVLKFFREENEPKLLDPIDLKTTIEELEADIEEFEAKIDNALTRANVTNDIEFEDPTA